MSDQIAPIDPNDDPWGYLGFIPNTDGSFKRLPGPPESPASSDPTKVSKDIPLNQFKVRVFVPRQAFESSPSTKLPVIVYFHAGGFVKFSAATSLFDDFYNEILTEIPAIVVSVDYRCAPEHRLPTAYDDGMEALHWIKNSNDKWLIKYADISKCFLMGTSAGGNISYNLGLRAAASDDLKPLEIKGLILHHPFFGATKRTKSELRLEKDTVIPLKVCDIMWELSLPIGADRDHPFCNPMGGMEAGLFDEIKLIKDLGWKVLVTGCHRDPLIDRQIKFVETLTANDVSVESKFEQEGSHGNDLWQPNVKKLSKLVKKFLVSTY